MIKLPVNGAVSIRGLFRLGGWDKLPSRGKFLSRAPGNTNLLITHDLAAKRELSSSMGPPSVPSLPTTSLAQAHGPPVSIPLFTNITSSNMPGKLWLILENLLTMSRKAPQSILNYGNQVNSILSQDFGVNICNLLCQMCQTAAAPCQYEKKMHYCFSAANTNHYKHIM